MSYRFAPALLAGACFTALNPGSASAQVVASNEIVAPEFVASGEARPDAGAPDNEIVVTARCGQERAQERPVRLIRDYRNV